ncbi:unnamed protein product [Sphagnum balticum]
MGATREDEGSGKEGKRRRAPRNLVLNFLRRLPHSSVVCNRLASHLHIGGLDMRYESWKFAQNDGRHMRIPHSSPSHRMNLRKRPKDECASSEDDRQLSESVDVSVRNVAYFDVTDVRKNDSHPRRNG